MVDLDEVEQAFAARGADVQVELSHLGDPQIAAVLTDRGYRLASFENVLGLASMATSSQWPLPESRYGEAARQSSTLG